MTWEPAFFRKLKAEQDNELPENSGIVSMHPNCTNRIREAQEYLPDTGYTPETLLTNREDVKDQLIRTTSY